MATEERYGRLVVLERRNSRCQVRCDCGVEKIVRRTDLLRGRTTSCGCLWRERITGHGHTRRGLSKSPEWRSWQNMKQRCLNPNNANYDYYGGRGITVVDRWLGDEGFVNFLADLGQRPAGCSLDRIDNDQGYGPDNCRWATAAEQAANSRRRLAPALTLLHEIREVVELPGELAGRVARLLGDPTT